MAAAALYLWEAAGVLDPDFGDRVAAAAGHARSRSRHPLPPFRDGRLIHVDLGHATFGLVVDGGRVVDCAPVALWALGRGERQVADYYRGRGATFTAVG